MMIIKIISGGQTGADQGGLFGARDAGFPTGGYAPEWFRTENGFMPGLLKEFGLIDSGLTYVGRTRKNVKESDVTIWFGATRTPGHAATSKTARDCGKPFMVFFNPVHDLVADQIADMKWHTVNIAGNCESKNPGIFESTRKDVYKILTTLKMIVDNEQLVTE